MTHTIVLGTQSGTCVYRNMINISFTYIPYVRMEIGEMFFVNWGRGRSQTILSGEAASERDEQVACLLKLSEEA